LFFILNLCYHIIKYFPFLAIKIFFIIRIDVYTDILNIFGFKTVNNIVQE